MKNILVIPYAFDSSSQIFAHQVEVIEKISESFSKTIVLTNLIGLEEKSRHSSIVWSRKSKLLISEVTLDSQNKFLYALSLIRRVNQIIKREKVDIVFYFMTDSQASVIAPFVFVKFRRTRQFLWYAHKHRSFRLMLAYPFMTSIFSSTRGSIPLRGSKIRLLGQMINAEKFPLVKTSLTEPLKFVCVGRFDPSKDLESIISVILGILPTKPGVTVTFLGSPSNNTGVEYIKKLMKKYQHEIAIGTLSFCEPVKRDNLTLALAQFDVFIHAFPGSLDKTLIEATLCGLPVVTMNGEYHEQIGRWSADSKNLLDELKALYSFPEMSLSEELQRRRALAMSNHSLEHWISGFKREILG